MKNKVSVKAHNTLYKLLALVLALVVFYSVRNSNMLRARGAHTSTTEDRQARARESSAQTLAFSQDSLTLAAQKLSEVIDISTETRPSAAVMSNQTDSTTQNLVSPTNSTPTKKDSADATTAK